MTLPPLRPGEDAAAWLEHASKYGVPAIVPCHINGGLGVAFATLGWRNTYITTAALHRDPELRVRAMIAACTRTRRYAIERGAEVDL